MIARVWGIPIKVHITLLLALPLIYADFKFFTAVTIACGVFASIALHELGHSFVAIRKGCQVREILLLPIGGVARMTSIPTKPFDEFLMAIAGPAVSMLLCVALSVGGGLLALAPRIEATHGNVLQFVGLINGALAAFNLIPAFPMDGGRILRALLTRKYGRLRATSIAARVGRTVAILLGMGGLYLWHKHGGSAWTLIIIAIFIHRAAGNEYRAVARQEAGGFFGSGFRPVDRTRGPTPPQDVGQAVVSPPPYEKGSGEKRPIDSFRRKGGN